MRVHVVHKKNQNLYPELLEQFYRERHKVYAEELGWVPSSPDGLEKDDYDTARAIYFLGVENDRVIAGSRLSPTTEPHLLSDVFPHLCTRGIVRGETVAEWTRGFVSRSAREGTDKSIIFKFCHAVMDYALQQGLSQIGGIQRTYWLTMWKWMGWNVHIQGEPASFDGDPWLPAYFDVSEKALKGAARRAKVTETLLVQDGPQMSFIPDQSVIVPQGLEFRQPEKVSENESL